MNVYKYIQLMGDLFSKDTTWALPRLSDWYVTGTGGTTVSGGTEGMKFDVSIGTVEIALRHKTANLEFIIEGKGAGVGVGVGIGLPASLTYAGGEVPFGLGEGMDLPSGGIGCVVAGPKAHHIVISPQDLVTVGPGGVFPCMTMVSGSAGTQGQYSVGYILFADRPITSGADLAYVIAAAGVYGMQFELGNVISAGVSAMYYQMNLRYSSLPFEGAEYGASVAI